MGTRICIMNGGRVAQVGPPLEVYRHPANTFVASFLGNPPMNLLPAIATDKAGGRCLKVGEQRDRAAARPLPSAAAGLAGHLRDQARARRPESRRERRGDANRGRDRSRGAARRGDDRDRKVAGRREAGLRQARRRRHLPDRRAPAALSRCRHGPRIRKRWPGTAARLSNPRRRSLPSLTWERGLGATVHGRVITHASMIGAPAPSNSAYRRPPPNKGCQRAVPPPSNARGLDVLHDWAARLATVVRARPLRGWAAPGFL